MHAALTGVFAAGITMFKNLPRQVECFTCMHPAPWVFSRLPLSCASAAASAQVFGRLQAKLFPLYFMLAIACLVLQLGTLAFEPGSGIAKQQLVTLGALFCKSSLHTPWTLRTITAKLLLDAGIALVASLANGFLVEPKATESMFKRYELESQDVKDAERIKVNLHL